jgi:hypothetical protein
MHNRIVRNKMILLKISVLLFLIALGFGVFAFAKGWLELKPN